MLNLTKYLKKCDVLEKEDYGKKLLSKVAHDSRMKWCKKLDDLLSLIIDTLDVRLSLHPLDTIGCLYIMDIINEDDIILAILTKKYDHLNTNMPILEIPNIPKNIILFKIIDTLYMYKEFKEDIDNLINIASEIEKSCFNATIHNCRYSDDPPPRNWDSELFVDIYYSSRCSTILRLLSPNSMSSIEYGPILVNKLISKEILPNNVGFMSESEICPESQEIERFNLQKRMDQKIEEKFSNLYVCPSCKERKCSYTTVQRRALDEAADVICKCLNPECLITFNVK
jgi:DNA-directed RNA polymerase subunit M/transcription elongation factor TFIIS